MFALFKDGIKMSLVDHPQDAGFSVGLLRPRHDCGQFATLGTRLIVKDKKGHNLSWLKCARYHVFLVQLPPDTGS